MLPGLFVLTSIAQGYQIQNRWSTTATDGDTGSRGDSITITWGIVADATTISGAEGSSGSTLISLLDTRFGAGPGGSDLTERPWFSLFTASFARLGEVSGVTYVFETNNTNQAIDSSPSPFGQLGVVPDIRIGGHSIDGGTGANTVAYSYFPNHSDLVIDTDNTSQISSAANDHRSFRNLLMHESIHGLGIHHVVSTGSRFMMEPRLDTNFDGPQLDDILALQRNYGDSLEKNTGNDSFETATVLGSLLNGATLSIGTLGESTVVASNELDFISIDGISDIDFFSFTLERTLDVTLNLTPRGPTYNQGPESGPQAVFNAKMLSDLTLSLFDTDGTTLVDSANNSGAGLGESISHQLLPGTYYAQIIGANDDVQLYGLDISGTRVAGNLGWTGQQSNDWDVNSTANFADSVGAVPFYDQDQVTFDDTASTFTVNLAENVQPASIIVNSSGTYSFSGPGGIVAGALTLTGGGTLELANDGNIYEGPTDVQAGTLIIISASGIGDTTVQSGAIVGGGGTVGGNLIAMDGAMVLPGSTLTTATIEIEQDSTLTVDGDFTQLMGSTLKVQLRSAADYDELIVGGIATLDGTLDVQLAENFATSLGEQFEILTATGGLSGMFTSLILPDPGSFLAFDLGYDVETVTLSVVSALSGDFNVDGQVNGLDFIVWQRGNSPIPLSAEDLADWQANYGIALVLPSALHAVPEPSTGLILVMGLCFCVGRNFRETRSDLLLLDLQSFLNPNGSQPLAGG